MKYPNAAKGIKKLFIAEIITAAAAIFSIFLMWTVIQIQDEYASYIAQMDSVKSVLSVLSIITSAVPVVVLVLRLVGFSDASKDESAFRVALFAGILDLILCSGNTVLGYANTPPIASDVGTSLRSITNLICFMYCILGIRNLADRLNRPDIRKRSTAVLWTVLICVICGFLFNLMNVFSGKSEPFSVFTFFGLLSSILMETLFIILLADANEMLTESVVLQTSGSYAANGVKLLIVAVFFAIFAAASGFIYFGFTYIMPGDFRYSLFRVMDVSVFKTISMVAPMLWLVGLKRTSKDKPIFRDALLFSIINGILWILSLPLHSKNVGFNPIYGILVTFLSLALNVIFLIYLAKAKKESNTFVADQNA